VSKDAGIEPRTVARYLSSVADPKRFAANPQRFVSDTNPEADPTFQVIMDPDFYF